MKKFVVLLVVVAMTFVTGMAFAAEVTVGGELAVRSRSFGNMDLNDNAPDTDKTSQRDTQTRVKLDVNAKAGDVRGKVQLWNDWEPWNGLEAQDGTSVLSSTTTGTAGPQAYNDNKNSIGIREAWISFPLPGIPVTVTAGHQLLTIGNGWFFRSNHFGSDAWVISNATGPNTAAFVNVKVAEGDAQSADDIDAYALIDVFKISDAMSVGADITMVNDRKGKGPFGNPIDLQNIGVNFNGKIGPVALKAEVDFQMGTSEAAAGDKDFSGSQFVVQGSVPAGPVGINFTAAVGSGQDNSNDVSRFVNFLDVDPHYTLMYEYKIADPNGNKNFGFANTTALGVGATFVASNSLTVGADFWMLAATEQGALPSDDIGQEIDVKVNWKVAENLAWNWVIGQFSPGDAYGPAKQDTATGIQGALIMKF